MLIVVGGLIYRDGKLLIAQRPPGKHGALKWEFPGGKLEAEEDPRDCLVREVKEELDVDIAVERIAEVVYHRYPDRAVLLLFYVCRYRRGEARAIDCADFAWVEPSRLTTYDFLAADLDLIRQLSSGKTF
ncbi:(deoxy)nucleoside triphosphate pyrophosphohydrolase [bacterium]|nr:(deoxy)nucleoside triphosphate pyrophosphohydrolase [bacterium]